MFPFIHDPDHPEHPLTDQEAIAQVVEPAKQIAEVAALQDVSGGFSWEACNDQGEPPYRGRVDMTFVVPAGADHGAYFQQVADTMVAHGCRLVPHRASTCSVRGSTRTVSWQASA